MIMINNNIINVNEMMIVMIMNDNEINDIINDIINEIILILINDIINDSNDDNDNNINE